MFRWAAVIVGAIAGWFFGFAGVIVALVAMVVLFIILDRLPNGHFFTD